MRKLAHLVAIVLVIVFSLVSKSDAVIDTQEKAALTSIFHKYPNLAFVTSMERFASQGSVDDWGSAWSSSFDTLCSSGEGYEIYGVHCSAAGHVDALFLYV